MFLKYMFESVVPPIIAGLLKFGNYQLSPKTAISYNLYFHYDMYQM